MHKATVYSPASSFISSQENPSQNIPGFLFFVIIWKGVSEIDFPPSNSAIIILFLLHSALI